MCGGDGQNEKNSSHGENRGGAAKTIKKNLSKRQKEYKQAYMANPNKHMLNTNKHMLNTNQHMANVGLETKPNVGGNIEVRWKSCF